MGEVQNGYQWNGQQWVALGELGGSGPASKPEKPWYKKWWAIAIGVILALGILGNLMEGDEQSAAPATTIPSPTVVQTTSAAPAPAVTPNEEPAVVEETPVVHETTEAPAPSVEAPAPAPALETTEAVVSEEPVAPTSSYGEYPADQAAFIDGVTAAAQAYEDAATDLQQAKVLRDRNRDLLADGEVSNWVGVLEDVSANNEGKAVVSVQISDDIHVKTWNNAFSDLADNTLIPESSPVYDALLAMEPGQQVVFSGSFVSKDGGTVYPTNITDVFSAATPEFLFKFSAVAPA